MSSGAPVIGIEDRTPEFRLWQRASNLMSGPEVLVFSNAIAKGARPCCSDSCCGSRALDQCAAIVGRPMMAKRSLPQTQSIAATVIRIMMITKQT